LDATFGIDGKVKTDFGSVADNGNALALQADGRIVVAGQTYNNFNNDFALVRYNNNGSLDTTFGTNGRLTTDFGNIDNGGNGVAIQLDGKILVAGYVRGDFAVARYTDIVFADVSPGYWAWDFIERLYRVGITSGCAINPFQYCPEGIITRAQMAVLLERGIHGSAFTPPQSTGGLFADVPPSYWAAAWIEKLATDGITSGCSAGNYCPESMVMRAQMAVFLLRSKYGSSYDPPAVGVSTGFTDVSSTYWAAAWIKQLVAEGITAGCGTSTFCPEAPVTRAQMAVFLVRTFNLP
jgi:uncharacterized delta-60 repeat protein